MHSGFHFNYPIITCNTVMIRQRTVIAYLKKCAVTVVCLSKAAYRPMHPFFAKAFVTVVFVY